MATITNVSFKRQVNTSENGSKVFGSSTAAGGFIATFKKGSDAAGGALVLEGNLSAGNSATDTHQFRGTVTFGTITTIVVDDSGNITIGGNASIGGILSVTGSANFGANVTINGNIFGAGADGQVKVDNTAVLTLSARAANTLTGALGEIFVDTADNNRLKYFDGTAFQTVQTGATLTFNAVREKIVVGTNNAGRTSYTIAQTPIGADAAERNAMVKVYLNGIYLEEHNTTSSNPVTDQGGGNWTFTITVPPGESITAWSLTFTIDYTSGALTGTIKGKDNGNGGIVDDGSTGGVTIQSGTVNYSTGAVSITLSQASTPTSNAVSTFSVADYSYTDPTKTIDVFGTIAGDKIFVWYLTA